VKTTKTDFQEAYKGFYNLKMPYSALFVAKQIMIYMIFNLFHLPTLYYLL